MRVFSRDLDKAFRDDVPIAIDMVTRAKYFTLVLDEEPKTPLEPPVEGDADELNRKELQVQLVPHPVRVGIWEMESGRRVFRMRTSAGAELMPIGRNHIVEQRVQNAQQRQANNCGIALDVKERIERWPRPRFRTKDNDASTCAEAPAAGSLQAQHVSRSDVTLKPTG